MTRARKLLRTTAATALACLASMSFAQGQILKQVTADGRVIYTDSPVPNAKTEKKIQVDTSTHGSSTWSATQAGLKPGLTGQRAPDSFNVGIPGAPLGVGSLPPLPGSSIATVADKAAERQKAESAAETKRMQAAEKERRLSDAQIDLQMAMARQEQGKEPQAGERTGIANGGSRLNEKYLARQAELAQAVTDAERKLDEAQK